MKIGLPFAAQIRGTSDDTATPSADTDPITRLGGFVALQEQQIVAAVTAGYHTEHHDDDTHSTIHCDAIYERDRTTAMGEWMTEQPDPSKFTANGTMTWTVPSASQTFRYMLVGKTMTVLVAAAGTTVGGVANTELHVRIPGGFIGKAGVGTYHLVDAGTYEIGLYQITNGNNYVTLFRQNFTTNFAAGTVDVRAMLIFEVQ